MSDESSRAPAQSPPLTTLKETLDEVELQIDKWEGKGRSYCAAANRVARILVLGSSLVTVLGAFGTAFAMLDGPRWSKIVLLCLSTLAGVGIAVATGFNERHKYAERWARARSYADSLRSALREAKARTNEFEGLTDKQVVGKLNKMMDTGTRMARDLPVAPTQRSA